MKTAPAESLEGVFRRMLEFGNPEITIGLIFLTFAMNCGTTFPASVLTFGWKRAMESAECLEAKG